MAPQYTRRWARRRSSGAGVVTDTTVPNDRLARATTDGEVPQATTTKVVESDGEAAGGVPLDRVVVAGNGERDLVPDDAGVPGLVELLNDAELGSYAGACLRWCSEMGAADLDELRESAGEIEVAVGLRPLERLRFRRALNVSPGQLLEVLERSVLGPDSAEVSSSGIQGIAEGAPLTVGGPGGTLGSIDPAPAVSGNYMGLSPRPSDIGEAEVRLTRPRSRVASSGAVYYLAVPFDRAADIASLVPCRSL